MSAFRPEVEQWRDLVVNAIMQQSNRGESLCSSTVLALIAAESSGNPDAVGRTDEIGLMQILPTSDRPPRESLFDPALNIAVGVEYLNRMLNMFGGDLVLALIAYRRGPRRVDSAGDEDYSNAQKVIDWALGDLRPADHPRLPPGTPTDSRSRTPTSGGESPCLPGLAAFIEGALPSDEDEEDIPFIEGPGGRSDARVVIIEERKRFPWGWVILALLGLTA